MATARRLRTGGQPACHRGGLVGPGRLAGRGVADPQSRRPGAFPAVAGRAGGSPGLGSGCHAAAGERPGEPLRLASRARGGGAALWPGAARVHRAWRAAGVGRLGLAAADRPGLGRRLPGLAQRPRGRRLRASRRRPGDASLQRLGSPGPGLSARQEPLRWAQPAASLRGRLAPAAAVSGQSLASGPAGAGGARAAGALPAGRAGLAGRPEALGAGPGRGA